jgi:hypothetical protein
MIDPALIETIRAELEAELVEAEASVVEAQAALETARAATAAVIEAHRPVVALIEHAGRPDQGAIGSLRRAVPASLLRKIDPHRHAIRRAEGGETEASLVLESARWRRDDIIEAIARLDEVAGESTGVEPAAVS